MPRKKQQTQRKTIVCTCREENYGWIGKRRLYNLPLPKGGTGESYVIVTHIAIYALDLPVIARAAKYLRDVDGAWLAANGYGVSPKPHGEKYALFELGGEMKESALYTDAEVYVCSTRWTGRIDTAFFEKPLPQCGGKSLPNIFERLRPFFAKCRTAMAYNPVQLDFLSVLFTNAGKENESNCQGTRSFRNSNDLTCLDFFAGSGLVSIALSSDFRTVWANDISAKKALVFNANNPPGILDLRGVESVNGKVLPPVALSWGSFPCQDLSLAGKMEGLYANRSGLFWQWLRVMDEMAARPPVVVAENVPGLVSVENGRYYVEIHRQLTHRGYNVGAVLIDAVHWVPQSRKRVFVIGIRKDIDLTGFEASGPIEWCHPKPIVKVAKTIPDWHWWKLPRPKALRSSLGEIIDFDEPCDSEETQSKKLALINPKKIELMRRACRNGRRAFTGYRRTRNHIQVLEVRMDGIAGCLRTPRGGSSRQEVIIGDHGELRTRLLTVRETARLMGAPDSFRIPGTYNDGYMAMGDGVAVPVASYLSSKLLAPLARRAF